jgi:hypothetical protein
VGRERWGQERRAERGREKNEGGERERRAGERVRGRQRKRNRERDTQTETETHSVAQTGLKLAVLLSVGISSAILNI